VFSRVTSAADFSFRNRRYHRSSDSLPAVNHDETADGTAGDTDPSGASTPSSDSSLPAVPDPSTPTPAVESEQAPDEPLLDEAGRAQADAVTTAEVPPAADSPEPHDRPSRRSGVSTAILAIIGFGLIAVLAMQVYLLISASSTSDQVAEIEAAVVDLSGDVARVEGSVDEVGTQVAEIEAAATASSPATGGSPQAAVEAGFLPRFEQGAQDTALGMPLATIEGDEYYTETAVSVDPTDGTRRVWLVWAHWCPYCQEELPELSAWWSENSASYENVEMIGVTTSIDPSRGNPLEPYLDELELPFPTIVDHDLTTAARFGTSAFPFWVVTDGDGTVLFRAAGLLPIEQVEAIFNQLRDMPA
jgi:thiol-disulfide isomerase/thioredoxin